MPSPFPGMDPYLEDPARWPGVHHRFISEIQDLLNQQLRPKYYAMVEERVYISDEDDPGRAVLVPDVRIARRRSRRGKVESGKPANRIQVAEPVVRVTVLDEQVHEARLKVIDRAGRSVITFIEVLSPSNKVAGSNGRASYEEKRQEVMASPSHFVEIDLLRAGVPIPAQPDRPAGDYFVHVSPAPQRPEGRIWAIGLRDKLPVVPIPLKPEDAAATLDLQAVLDLSYDRAGYDLDIDYRQSPVVPLNSADASWARQLLRRKGLR